MTRGRAFAAIAILLGLALYLGDLTGMGMVGPDEPRYASIGRAMATSGDWVTPRLWGSPWFEKPALLYWMTATGFKLGLGPDLAPRLPVALLGVAFLGFFWWRVFTGWGSQVATYAATILATSAGWLAYSHAAVTDIPVSVFFSAALLLALPWVERGETALLPYAAACLGVGTLAKGLVPLVLFFPVLLIGWRRAADWFRPAPLLAFSVCALPWYILCTMANGNEFLRVFFLEQQFGRFGSTALQHVQPWYFYGPVALLLLFPWFPLIGLAFRGTPDRRLRTLAAAAVFGFVFFSASVNKLPSYLLPLLPGTCILLAAGLDRAPRPGRWMVAPLAVAGILPALPGVVAMSFAHGLRAATIPWATIGTLLALAAGIGVMLSAKLTSQACWKAVGTLVAIGFIWFQIRVFPSIDVAASTRTQWLAAHPKCAPAQPRNTAYGLYYYSDGKLPECALLDPNAAPGVR